MENGRFREDRRVNNLNSYIPYTCRRRWLRGLRRGSSTAARLVGMWFRIPPVHVYLSLVSIVYRQVDVCVSG